MKNKKTPERFSIRFDPSIPDHKLAIEILTKKGRNAARYIAEAIKAYETNNNDTIKETVTEVVSQILEMNAIVSSTPQKVREIPDFDFADIADDLNGFKT